MISLRRSYRRTWPSSYDATQFSFTSIQPLLTWHGFQCSPDPAGIVWKEPQLIYVLEWKEYKSKMPVKGILAWLGIWLPPLLYRLLPQNMDCTNFQDDATWVHPNASLFNIHSFSPSPTAPYFTWRIHVVLGEQIWRWHCLTEVKPTNISHWPIHRTGEWPKLVWPGQVKFRMMLGILRLSWYCLLWMVRGRQIQKSPRETSRVCERNPQWMLHHFKSSVTHFLMG